MKNRLNHFKKTISNSKILYISYDTFIDYIIYITDKNFLNVSSKKRFF